MVAFTDIQTAKTLIDNTVIKTEFGVEEDDIDAAIGESMKLCLMAMEEKMELIEMKAE